MTARLTKERIAEIRSYTTDNNGNRWWADFTHGDGLNLVEELLDGIEALAAEADRYREALEEIERELLPFAKSNAAGMSVLAALGACSSALTADTKEGK